ncbi:hypothetical protein, partial [Salmonella enterica]|uniref:hypothetical protein n=1 Tax=Salmonella enterica TaxID=28901 RepID=UPI0020C2CC14
VGFRLASAAFAVAMMTGHESLLLLAVFTYVLAATPVVLPHEIIILLSLLMKLFQFGVSFFLGLGLNGASQVLVVG